MLGLEPKFVALSAIVQPALDGEAGLVKSWITVLVNWKVVGEPHKNCRKKDRRSFE